MIKSNKGYVELNGTAIDLSTELISIMKALMDKDVLAKADVKNCFDIACMSEEEVHDAAMRSLERMGNMINQLKSLERTDTFSSMFDDLFEDE